MGYALGPSEYFAFVEGVEKYLESDFVRQVKDVDFGQWELPFEAILIELMKLRKDQTAINDALVRYLAVEAGIVEAGVLDADTWQKFCHWANLDQ